MLIQQASVFYRQQFQVLDVRVENGQVVEIADQLQPHQETVVDGRGKLLLPGLLDVHSHGCVGADFSTANEEDLAKMRHFYASQGITSLLATTMTMSKDDYRLACRRLNTAMDTPLADGCRLWGINMEGPFLSPAKRGAHDAQYLNEIDPAYFEELDKLSGNRIRLVDLDPDLEGAIEFIKQYQSQKTISLAHTACDYETGCRAVEAGASQITHLFNAMNGLHHRLPALFGVLQDYPIFAELIADGIHIHPSVVRMLFTWCPEKLVLISDSMSACGLGDGQYVLGGLDVTVKNQKATLSDGTIAGSTCTVWQAMQRAVSFGVSLPQAVLAATENPAKAVGLSEVCGKIAVGVSADLVLASTDLEVEQVWIAGKPIA